MHIYVLSAHNVTFGVEKVNNRILLAIYRMNNPYC